MPTMIKKYLKDKQGNYLAPFTTADMVEHADGETTEVKLQTLENQVGDTVLTTTAQNVTDAINELNTEIVGAKTDATPTTYNSLGERLDAMDLKIQAGGDVTKAYVDQQDDDIKATIGVLGDLATDEQTSIVLSINEIHDEAITCEDYTGTTTTVADLSTRVGDLEVDNVAIIQELEDSHTGTDGTVYGTIGQRLDDVEGDIALKRDDLAPTGGAYFQGTPKIMSNGVMEIGQHIDFHSSATDTSDYTHRLSSTTTGLACVGHFLNGSLSGSFDLGHRDNRWRTLHLSRGIVLGDDAYATSQTSMQIELGKGACITGAKASDGTIAYLLGNRLDGDWLQLGGNDQKIMLRVTNVDDAKVCAVPVGGNIDQYSYTIWHDGNAWKNRSGAWWNNGPIKVEGNGVSEIGKYIDFHASHTSTSDWDVRLEAFPGYMTIAGHCYPSNDNARALGKNDLRWTAVYATNGTIQTSDMKHKSDIRDIDDNIFFNMIKNSGVHSYVLNYADMPDNVTQETAPIEQVHIGIIAQEVAQHEGWEYVLNTETDENGEIEYSVNNYNLTSAVMAALKIEITKREELQERYDLLEQQYNELQTQLEEIKNHVGL